MEMSGYIYHCSAGETFDSIALTVYGSERFAPRIMTANPQFIRAWIFRGTENLRLPVIVQTSDDESGYPVGSAPWREG